MGYIMISVGKFYKDQEDYTKDCVEEKVEGKLKKHFGIEMKMEKSMFSDLHKGLIGGKDLKGKTFIEQRENNRSGYDIVFNPDKSVTLAYSLGSVAQKKLISKAHNAAISDVIKHIEKNLIYYETMKDDTKSLNKSNNLLAFKYQHQINRKGEPHLHTHLAIANFTYAKKEDKFYRIVGKKLYNPKLFEAIYQSALLYNLREQGLPVKSIKHSGDYQLTVIEGISNEVVAAFSQRTKILNEKVDEFLDQGMGLEKAYRVASQVTKESKDKLLANNGIKGLEKGWQETFKQEIAKGHFDKSEFVKYNNEKNRLQIVKGEVVKITQKERISTANESVQLAKKSLLKKEISLTPEKFFEIAVKLSEGKCKYQDIKASINRENKNLVTLKKLGPNSKDTERMADPKVIVNEMKFIKIFNYLAEQQADIIPKNVNEKKFKELLKSMDVSWDKQTVLHSVFYKSKLTVVEGHAGTGKTTLLKQLKELTEKYSEYGVVGLSHSGKATQEMIKANITAETIDSFLYNPKSLQNKILIIDEASVLSNEHFRKLLKYVDKSNNTKIMLVGDRKQLQAIEAGNPFKIALEYTKKAFHPKLTYIYRQKQHSDYQEFTKDISDTAQNTKMDSLNQEFLAKNFIQTDDVYGGAKREFLSKFDENQDQIILVKTVNLKNQLNEEVRKDIYKNKENVKAVDMPVYKDIRMKEDYQIHLAKNYVVGDEIICRNKNEKSLVSGKIKSIDVENNILTIIDTNSTKKEKLTEVNTKHLDNMTIHREEIREFALGERVMFTKNKGRQTKNGEIGTITDISDAGIITIEKTSGHIMQISSKNPQYKYLDYAYASTISKSQGSTFDKVICTFDTKGQWYNFNEFYVGITRGSNGEDGLKVFTDDKAFLFKETIRNIEEKETSLGYIAKNPESAKQHKIKNVLKEYGLKVSKVPSKKLEMKMAMYKICEDI